MAEQTKEFDDIALAKELSRSKGDRPRVPRGPGRTVIALVEHPDPLCRMRSMIRVEREGKAVTYELTGWKPESLVNSVLACAGFAGPYAPPGKVAVARDFEEPIPVMSFELPEGVNAAAMESKIARVLRGEGRGFYPVVAGQNFFHYAFGAFEELWKAAGCPPVRVAKADHFRWPRGDAPFLGAKKGKSVHATTLRDPDEAPQEAASTSASGESTT